MKKKNQKTFGPCGVAFQLVPQNGGWQETVLANFNGANESSPLANVVFVDHGKLLGTTQTGGMEVGFPQSAVLPGPEDALYGTTTASFENRGEMFAITH